MIESFGTRPTATSGPAAGVSNGQQGEKIVHRPVTRVLPPEPVDRTAQTGPRPAFKHTYLEWAAAQWPNEPDRPVTYVDYDAPESRPEPEAHAVEEGLAAIRQEETPDPMVDIRR